MSFLLDTDTCSAYLRRPTRLFHRFLQHSGRLHVPTIVVAELHAWAYDRADPQPMLGAIATFLASIEVIGFDRPAAEEFGRLRLG